MELARGAAPAPSAAVAGPPRAPLLGRAVQRRFNLQVVGGSGAINNLGQAAQVIVEIRDQNNRPAAALAVVFVLPDGEPGGLFPDGTRQVVAQTDATGRATATWEARGVGPYEVRVEVEGELLATITQTNAQSAGGGMSTRTKVWLGIAGAAAAGAAVALAGSSSSSSPPGGGPTRLSLPPGRVGPPN